MKIETNKQSEGGRLKAEGEVLLSALSLQPDWRTYA
jgi:hypothetical protein